MSESGYLRVPHHLPSGRQGVGGPTHLPVIYTHSPRVTRVPAPQGRAVSHALAVPHVPCHTHTHRITHSVTRSVLHIWILLFLSLGSGSLAPSRALGAAWELPFLSSRFVYPRLPSAPVQYDLPPFAG